MIYNTQTYRDSETGIELRLTAGKVTITPGTQTLSGSAFSFKQSDPRMVLKVCKSIMNLVNASRDDDELI